MKVISAGKVWAALLLAASMAGAEPIAWTQAVNVTVAGTRITKTGDAAWNGGAVSTKALVSGDGFVQYTVQAAGLRTMFGLARTNKSESYADIDFALSTAADGSLHVYEGGLHRGGYGTYAAGDVLRVGVESGTVRYYRNGTAFYTSALAPRYPMAADASIFDPGATIGVAAIAGTLALVGNVVWRDCVGTSQCLGAQTGANSLTKTAATSVWDSGAVSTQAIAYGDGFVEFSAGDTAHTLLCGLGNGNAGAGKGDIEFGLRADAFGNLSSVEDGVQMGVTIGTYLPGDRLRVYVENGVVKYGKNGVRLYASNKTPTYPLRVDTSFLTTGGTLKDVVIGGAALDDVRTEDVAWTGVANAAATGSTLTKTGTPTGWNAGGISTRTVTTDAFVEFTATAADAALMVGLGHGDAGTEGQAIDDAVQLTEQGTFTVYHAGTWVGTTFGSYAAGDRFRIEVTGTAVHFRRNGNVFYSSAAAPVYPLRADAALWSPGARVDDVVIGWTVPPPAAARPTPTSGGATPAPTAMPTSTGPSCPALCGIASGTCHQGCSSSQPCHDSCEGQYDQCLASCPVATVAPTSGPTTTPTPTPMPRATTPTPSYSCEAQCGMAAGVCHGGCSTSNICHNSCNAQYDMCLALCVPPATVTPTAVPTADLPDAAMVGPYEFPNGMRLGAVYPVSVTMRNTGRPWTRDYKLEVIAGTLLPGGVRYDLPPGVTEVPTGGSATFAFDLSPSVPVSGVATGSISFRMVHVGVGAFGDVTQIQDVFLGDPLPPTAIALDRTSGGAGAVITVRRTDALSAALLPFEAGGRLQFAFGDPLMSPYSLLMQSVEWQSYDSIKLTLPPDVSCGTHYLSVQAVATSSVLPFEVVAPCDNARRNTFDLMTYNVQLLPETACGVFGDHCVKAFRVPRIAAHPDLQDHDVIVFEEAFVDEYATELKALFMPQNLEQYRYSTKLDQTDGLGVDGGVLILSKWPITVAAAHYYGACSGTTGGANDCLGHKGAAYVQIDKGGRRYHVFGTHTDAGGGDGDEEARRVQFGELGSFIAQTMLNQGNYGSEPVLIAGDLNVNKNASGQAEYLRMISGPYLNAQPLADGDILRTSGDSYPVSTNRHGEWLDYVLLARNYLQPADTGTPRLRVVQPMTDISSWSAPFPYQFDYPYPVPAGLGPDYVNKGDLSDHLAVQAKFYFPFQ